MDIGAVIKQRLDCVNILAHDRADESGLASLDRFTFVGIHAALEHCENLVGLAEGRRRDQGDGVLVVILFDVRLFLRADEAAMK
jgi:hypothetical protein